MIYKNRPLKRIWLPGVLPDYVEDLRFSNNMDEQKRLVSIYERELLTIFDYVDPVKNNMSTYSLQIYQLFLKCCTEFENMCKLILSDNGYSLKNNSGIKDYYKINRLMLLDKYTCSSPYIGSQKFTPFIDWTNGHSLNWYQDYNSVKHNRTNEFAKANLNNVINSVAALDVLLYSQYGSCSTARGVVNSRFEIQFEDDYLYINNGIFEINRPSNSDYQYNYSFDWNTIKNDGMNFDCFKF